MPEDTSRGLQNLACLTLTSTFGLYDESELVRMLPADINLELMLRQRPETRARQKPRESSHGEKVNVLVPVFLLRVGLRDA